MPDPYRASTRDAKGDTCSWCPELATDRIVISTQGRSKIPYRVPVCSRCKRRIENNAARDKEHK